MFTNQFEFMMVLNIVSIEIDEFQNDEYLNLFPTLKN